MSEGGRRLSDLDATGLEEEIRRLGQPAYRARQLSQWLFEKGVFQLDEMGNIPGALRQALSESFTLPPIALQRHQVSVDGTQKMLYRLADDQRIESVLIPAGDRTTVCISSQVGCAVGCRFCASGINGALRNLSRGEIIEQFMNARRLAEESGRKLTNLVMMGMGEPMHNYDNVFSALAAINAKDGGDFGARRITVSTIGIRKGVEKLIQDGSRYTLAFSLHAPTDELRREIVPLANAMTVEEIRDAAQRYLKTTGREVTFEYVLLGEVNDNAVQARQLTDLLRGVQGTVNLIPYNPVPELPYASPDQRRVDTFAETLRRGGLKVSVRTRKGADIDAACGQLALKNK